MIFHEPVLYNCGPLRAGRWMTYDLGGSRGKSTGALLGPEDRPAEFVLFQHESELPPYLLSSLVHFLRREILANRPLAEGERRRNGIIFTKRGGAHEWEGRDAEGNLHGFNEHAPKLAENEIHGPLGLVHKLRWKNGSPEHRTADGCGWMTWNLGGLGEFEKSGDAWFRANCPADRFVTDDGRVLEFRMRDDGEADAFHPDLDYYLRSGNCQERRAAFEACRAFRDAERAKWELICNESELNELNDDAPSWVRTLAEKMWLERQTKWRFGPSERQLDLGDGFVSCGWGKGLRSTANGFESTGECCFVIKRSGAEWMIVHEREIPPEWPDDVRHVVRREVLENRPLEVDEMGVTDFQGRRVGITKSRHTGNMNAEKEGLKQMLAKAWEEGWRERNNWNVSVEKRNPYEEGQ